MARQFLSVSVYDGGFVYADESVPQAVRRRQPFVIGSPRSPASVCVAQLAVRLEQGVATRIAGASFFDRMSRWFLGR